MKKKGLFFLFVLVFAPIAYADVNVNEVAHAVVDNRDISILSTNSAFSDRKAYVSFNKDGVTYVILSDLEQNDLIVWVNDGSVESSFSFSLGHDNITLSQFTVEWDDVKKSYSVNGSDIDDEVVSLDEAMKTCQKHLTEIAQVYSL